MLRMDIVGTVFRKELREMLRDRRSLLIMFGVPLLLYPLLTVALGGLAQSQENKLKDEPARVIVRNGSAAPHLMAQLRAAGSGITIIDAPEAPTTMGSTQPATLPSTAPATSPAADGDRLETGVVDAILEVPPDAEALALAGEQPEFVVHLNRSRLRTSASAERKLEKAINEYERWVIEQRLAVRDVSPAVLAPLKTRTVDIATGGQRLGSMMSTMLPLFLLLTGTLGAFFPALNATTAERERGTLETLLASPAGRTEILLGKGLLVLLGGLLTAGLNVASMALVLRWLFAGMGRAGVTADLSIDPVAIALAYLAAVPTLVFVTALVIVCGLFSRTFQEANALALPVMLLPLASAAIALADPPTTPGLLLTPIANTTVIIRDVLTGRATIGAFLLASAASCLYAGLLVSAAARAFNTEQLVNPSWEPLSMKGLGRRVRGRPRLPRPPSIDVALALFALTLLLVLYVGPTLIGLDLLLIVLVSMVGLIAVPTLLVAWLAGWAWVQTFSLRRPTVTALAGAALVGIGLAPWTELLYVLQSQVWPASSEHMAESMKMFLPSVLERPILTALTIGALAGICEELLYRGPIQAAFLRRMPPWIALCAGGALFAAAHMDMHGFPIRMLLGVILGYVVWRGKSIFPAMLLHGVYDAVQLGRLAWAIRTQGVPQTLHEAAAPPVVPIDAAFWVQFAIGTVLLVAGGWLLRTAWRATPRTA